MIALQLPKGLDRPVADLGALDGLPLLLGERGDPVVVRLGVAEERERDHRDAGDGEHGRKDERDRHRAAERSGAGTPS